MPEPDCCNIWIWQDPDKKWLDVILQHIQATVPANKKIIILNCEDVKDIGASIPFTSYVFNLAIQLNLFGGEKLMFLKLKDVLSSIELCMEQEKKEMETSEINISDKDLIDYFNSYASLENQNESESASSLSDYFKQINCIDAWMVYRKLQTFKNCNCNYFKENKYLILGQPRSVILTNMINLFGENISNLSIETPLDASLHESPKNLAENKIVIATEPMKLTNKLLNSPDYLKFGSATEEYIEDTILAFLSLLVNSRNELALSKAMISPIINLSHQAFTALKHLAVQKEMPMCQVAVSYVTRLRLGGKGYAPPKDCPMKPHLKGLELFVDTLNQLQTIIEETSSASSAIKKLLNCLRRKLLKSDSEKVKESSLDIVIGNLQSILTKVLENTNSTISSSPGQICQEGLNVLYYFVNYVNCNDFVYDPEVALKKRKAKRTPLNLPPLLGYFRSPEDESSCDTKSSLNEDSCLSRASVIEKPVFQSYFHRSESSELSGSCVHSSTPCKTTFKGVFAVEKENGTKNGNSKQTSENSDTNFHQKKASKRSIFGDLTNENDNCKFDKGEKSSTKRPEKDSKTSAKKICTNRENASNRKLNSNKNNMKKGPKKTAKTFKQIQGQGKLTNFFTSRG